jgi:acetyl-CoA carboxylase biotin carboxyl carrier protein
MRMDIAKIRKLVQLVSDSGVAELEVETDDLSIRIRKVTEVAAPVAAPVPMTGPAAPAPAPAAAPPPVAEPAPAPAPSNLHEVRSPIVGTFYRAPEPDAPPFVEVGSTVRPGQTLCIVEAMKVMNEIEAEVAGTVREVCLEDGQPVEAEGVLLRIEPA